MPAIHVDNVVSSSADKMAKRRELQTLIQGIERRWGKQLRLQENIAHHWQVLSEYSQAWLLARWPAEQAARPGLKAFADVQAHWIIFLNEIIGDEAWSFWFPYKDFGTSWNLAEAEIFDELTGSDPAVDFKSEAFQVYNALFYDKADCPLSLGTADAVTAVTMVLLDDPARCHYSCYTGCSQELPTNLSYLQLDGEASDLTAIRHLRDQATRNSAFLQTIQERTITLNDLLLRSQSDPHESDLLDLPSSDSD